MAWTTPAAAVREDDASGLNIATNREGGKDYQLVTLVDDSQAPTGYAGNPLSVEQAPITGLAAPYRSAAMEAKAEDVATGATSLHQITCTASLATTSARWVWIVDKATMAGSVLTDLVFAPLLLAEGGMTQADFDKRPRACATALSVGLSSSPDTYVESGDGFFELYFT